MNEVEKALSTLLTPEKIMEELSSYMEGGTSSIDALVAYAEEHEIEIQTIGEIVKKNVALKAIVRDDAESLRLLEKTVKLPI
jgi:hypothetical protein